MCVYMYVRPYAGVAMLKRMCINQSVRVCACVKYRIIVSFLKHSIYFIYLNCNMNCTQSFWYYGAGCSSVDSVSAFEAVGRRIDPSQWTQLQFGLFSVPTSGPQLVYQRPWYVLFCLWKSAYKRSLAAYRKE